MIKEGVYCSICGRKYKHNAEANWKHFDDKHDGKGHPTQKIVIPLEDFI